MENKVISQVFCVEIYEFDPPTIKRAKLLQQAELLRKIHFQGKTIPQAAAEFLGYKYRHYTNTSRGSKFKK